MSEDHTETIGGMFDRGLKLRREVLGAEYVDNSVKSANEFMMTFQHITTEWCWAYLAGPSRAGPEVAQHSQSGYAHRAPQSAGNQAARSRRDQRRGRWTTLRKCFCTPRFIAVLLWPRRLQGRKRGAEGNGQSARWRCLKA